MKKPLPRTAQRQRLASHKARKVETEAAHATRFARLVAAWRAAASDKARKLAGAAHG